jgi:hypothetical protein
MMPYVGLIMIALPLVVLAVPVIVVVYLLAARKK